jgi:hypothetical protein
MAIPSDGARGGAPEPYQNKMFTYGPSAERRKAKQPYIWSYRWFVASHIINYLTIGQARRTLLAPTGELRPQDQPYGGAKPRWTTSSTT